MRYRFLAAAVIALILVLALPAFVFADSTSSPIKMQGQAIVIPGDRTQQVHIELVSDNDQNWFINTDLTVPAMERGNGGDREDDDEEEEDSYFQNSNTQIRGTFFIGKQNRTLTEGTASGTLYSNGMWEISLRGNDNATSLKMVFTIQSNGDVISIVEGQWPLLTPATTPPPTTTAVIPPAIAVTPPPAFIDIIPNAPSQPQVQTQNPPTGQAENNHLYWYISRTAAIAAYILLFINICLGTLLKTKYLDSMMKRWRTYDLHQFTAIFSGALIILHVFSLLGDKYFSFSVSQLLIPMASPYKPVWTALGAIALYAGALVAISSYVRKLIGQKTWRVVHYVSYLLFFVILFHGIMAGTDTKVAWMQWIYLFTGTFVVFLFLWRFFIFRLDQRLKPDQIRTTSWEQPGKNTSY